ncbi:MAG: DUF3592 domain-containing protein [Chloroflexota bacterium]
MNEQSIPGIIVIICVFGLCLLLVGGIAVGFGLVIRNLKKGSKEAKDYRAQAQSWQKTRAKILKSAVTWSGGEAESSRQIADIHYEFQVEGVAYSNSEILAGDKYFSARQGRQSLAVVDKYPVGLEVDVFYNPANPEEAALER